jgi:hypothetical protein
MTKLQNNKTAKPQNNKITKKTPNGKIIKYKKK